MKNWRQLVNFCAFITITNRPLSLVDASHNYKFISMRLFKMQGSQERARISAVIVKKNLANIQHLDLMLGQ